MRASTKKIYFCPRFHVNFYHSYRGDTPDERGFGKDIRIIRSILDDLDRLETEGITVQCAWDFDNAFTLGRILPAHAPDIIRRVRLRAEAGTDEIELMSWNNGLLTAQTSEELRLALSWAISAPDGSGARQQFGGFVPIARPQECMFTSSQIDVYRSVGIEAVSLYYSAVPFNGFGSFFPRLPAEKRYNPLTLRDPRTGAAMRLLPAINQGDVAEYYLSAPRMLRAVRGAQLRADDESDMLVVLDMDADDTFWAGFAPGFSHKFLPSFGGLYALMKSVASLPFVVLERPWKYLETHPDVAEIRIDQDVADGAFDGYSSWAEKFENYEVWTTIQKARKQWEAAKDVVWPILAGDGTPDARDMMSWAGKLEPRLREMAVEAMKKRLLALSTTHFGMAAPVMNVARLEKARQVAARALELSTAFLEEVTRAYGVKKEASSGLDTKASAGGGPNLGIEAAGAGGIRIVRGDFSVDISTPWVDYDHRIRRSSDAEVAAAPNYRAEGKIFLSRGGPRIEWTRAASVPAPGLARFDIRVRYPATEHRGWDRAKAGRLARTWDARWRQLAPFEIVAFDALPVDRPVHVWKEDFDGNVTSYTLDYYRYGGNSTLADINSHVTPAWIALSDGDRGIFVAQASPLFLNFAFCPLRQEIRGETQRVSMYPFGTLWGHQYRYPARVTGLGRLATVLTADHLFSSAPSWEGKEFSAALLIALYEGGAPPESLRREALARIAGAADDSRNAP